MDDRIRLAISERIDEIIQELRRSNIEYDKLRREIGESSGYVEGITEKLGDTDRNIWEQHFNMCTQVEVLEWESIYTQGVKDGFKLRKWLLE